METTFDAAGAFAAIAAADAAGTKPPRWALRGCLDRARWDELPRGVQEGVARIVARRAGVPFVGLSTCAQGDQRHSVAFFDDAGARFALIPGGSVRLGWDRKRKVVVSDAQLHDWKGGRVELNYPEQSFHDVLDGQLTVPRRVRFRPFLCEVEPRKATSLAEDGSHKGVVAALAKSGYRLPTSNQWEYAASAGSPQLFRWGDAWPEGTSYHNEVTFRDHKKPNAFGLVFLDDAYQAELCRERKTARGGDGGMTICGGMPDLETWVTFANAYVFGGPKRFADASQVGPAYARRVKPV